MNRVFGHQNAKNGADAARIHTTKMVASLVDAMHRQWQKTSRGSLFFVGFMVM